MELEGSDMDSDTYDVASDEEELDGALKGIRKELENDAPDLRKSKKRLAGIKFMQVAAEVERQQAMELLGEMGSDEEGLDEYSSENESRRLLVGSSFHGRRLT